MADWVAQHARIMVSVVEYSLQKVSIHRTAPTFGGQSQVKDPQHFALSTSNFSALSVGHGASSLTPANHLCQGLPEKSDFQLSSPHRSRFIMFRILACAACMFICCASVRVISFFFLAIGGCWFGLVVCAFRRRICALNRYYVADICTLI